jgi:hypothetical protein
MRSTHRHKSKTDGAHESDVHPRQSTHACACTQTVERGELILHTSLALLLLALLVALVVPCLLENGLLEVVALRDLIDDLLHSKVTQSHRSSGRA